MRITSVDDTLTIEWAEGERQSFAAEWLLDNAPEHRDALSGQRLIDVTDLPAQPRIRSARLEEGVVRLEWGAPAAPTRLRIDWLEQFRSPRLPSTRRWLEGAALDARGDFAVIDLEVLRSEPQRQRDWLERLISRGLALIEHVPAEGLLEAMSFVGRVQETNYGLVFEVRAVPQPENLAYSDLGLGLHTDNPYREPVPGFQALHAVSVSPDGGESLFADGFALAERLRAESPDDFATLTRTPVPFHYRSANAELAAERPLIQLDCRGEIEAVHYNNRSIAPLRLALPEIRRFYQAYRYWAEQLKDARVMLRYRLAPGEIVVFDNRRILHGRTGFTSQRHPRHLRGCYLTRDSVHGTTALLARERI